MKKVKRISVIYSLIGLFLLLIIFIPTNLGYNTVLIIATICFMFMFYSWFKVANILNYYTIFLASCFVFYYGQYVVYFITGENITRWMSITSNFPENTMNETAMFILRCVLILHIAVLLFFNSGKAKRVDCIRREIGSDKLYKETKHLKAHRLASGIFFCITYIPAMLIGVFKAALTSTLNYSDLLGYNVHIFGNPVDQILRLLASFAIAAFIYVIISNRGSRLLKIYTILILLYIGVYYLSGSRLRVTLFILIAVLIYNDLFNKISKMQAFMMIPIAIITLLVIGGIGATRSSFSTYGSMQGIINGIFQNFKENNIFISLLNEFGMTAVVITNVLVHCPNPIGFLWGKSYVFSLLYILPGFIWDEEAMLQVIDTDTAFHGYINKYSGVGSSFIAEAYYNFGYGSYIIVFIYGLFLAVIMNRLLEGNYKKDVIKSSMVYYVLALVLFSVRSDLYNLLRESLYAFIIIKILYMISLRFVGGAKLSR